MLGAQLKILCALEELALDGGSHGMRRKLRLETTPQHSGKEVSATRRPAHRHVVTNGRFNSAEDHGQLRFLFLAVLGQRTR